MRSAYLALFGLRAVLANSGPAVVLGHVGFQLFGVGAGGGLPSGLFGGTVEVVGEVFGVGVADFPGGGEAGVGLIWGVNYWV